jgi:hypothetical protein
VQLLLAAIKRHNRQAISYETINKTNVIFGDASKEIQAFSQTAARELGMAKQEALDFAASFGGLGKMAGKTGDDLANFSTDLVTLTERHGII